MKLYKISVLGDSISTYEGVEHQTAIYYDGKRAHENGMSSVDDSWWKQVIDAMGGELCKNNSYSGSLVSGDNATAACSEGRCSALHGADKPDVILVYMGTNDRGYGVNVQVFYEAYRTMLRRIKKHYPNAKIICATLLLGYSKDGTSQFSADSNISEFDYNNAIRAAVEEENCILADIAASGKCYETLDGCHPTKNGHSLIAALWLKYIADINR